MLSRLKSFFRRRAAARRRLIFQYKAGSVSAAADPIIVYRELESHGGPGWRGLVELVYMLSREPSEAELSMLTTPEAWKARTDRCHAAIKELASLSRKAFNLPPLEADGSGVTEEEAMSVLASFLEYTAGLANATQGFPN